jgi:hypothetical protein
MSKTENPPEHPSPRPRGDIFSRILSALVAITTILGIPVGLYGYYASQQASRVDRTFEFYKDFRGDTLQRGFSLLVEQWNAKAAEVETLLEKDDEAGLGQLVGSLLQSDEAQTALAQLSSSSTKPIRASTRRCATTMPLSRCSRIPPTRFSSCTALI